MKLRMLLTGVVLSLFAADAMAQVPATWLGSWKMNIAKSEFPGPPVKSQIDKNEAVDGALKYTSDRVSSEGKALRHEYTAKLDGKDYPYVGLPGECTISLTKVDDSTMEWTIKRGRTALIWGQTAYSPDGKSRTTTWAAKDPRATHVVAAHLKGKWVFDRQ